MGKVRSFIAATDIHRHKGCSNLTELIRLIVEDQPEALPEAVVLGGDSVGGGRPPRMGGNIEDWQPVYSPEDVKREVKRAAGYDLPVFITYGSHDLNAAGGNSSFFSGPYDMDGFYIYGISFCQMKYDSRSQFEEADYQGPDAADEHGCCAREAGEAFLKWQEGLKDGYPVFVMSHMPLHANRGDNLGALTWCRAFNEASKKRPVYVFFGHNHSAERRDPAPEKACYRVEPGSVLKVQTSLREKWEDVKIDFTYRNAGYILNGAASLVMIEDGSVRIKRYELTDM